MLPGGFAIMSAIFKMLDLQSLEVTDGALRQGVLYDLLGRSEQHDMRDVTIGQFIHRYAVDRAQAKRVTGLALALMKPLIDPSDEDQVDLARRLEWAAMLHEIGLSISHAGYHKHSAYILSYADMPGFSKMDQAKVALIALGHTGKLAKLSGIIDDPDEWMAVLCLRIAALVHRRRSEIDVSGPVDRYEPRAASPCMPTRRGSPTIR